MLHDENGSISSGEGDDDNNFEAGLVQLGFIEENNSDENNCNRLKLPNWKNWDGGKAGGFPVMFINLSV